MEKNKEEEKTTPVVPTKTINYIDDMGNKHRIYTDNKDIESYIRRNYDIIEINPQQDLTS
jgi:hypothetical protein